MIKMIVIFVITAALLYFIVLPLMNRILNVLMWIPNKLFPQPQDANKDSLKRVRKVITIEERTKLQRADKLQYYADKIQDFEFTEKVDGVDWNDIVSRLDSKSFSKDWRDGDVEKRYVALSNMSRILTTEAKDSRDKEIYEKWQHNAAIELIATNKRDKEARIVQAEIDAGVKEKLSKVNYRRTRFRLVS